MGIGNRLLSVVACLVVVVVDSATFAQDTEDSDPALNPPHDVRSMAIDLLSPLPPPFAEPPHRFTRGQVVGLAALSGVLALGTIGVDRLPAATIFGVKNYYLYLTEASADVPLIGVEPLEGLAMEGLQLAAIGTSIALRYGKDHDATFTPYWAFSEDISFHLSLWGTYATYRDARLQGSDDAWNDKWHPASADELILAPFMPKNLDHPIVYDFLIGLAALEGLSVGLSGAKPFHAGPAARDALLGVAASFSAGVTEEAFFRGVFYEELKLSLGVWPARVIDSTTFSLAHIPGEIGAESTTSIVIGIPVRIAGGLLLEAAYDEGGLPESVAVHVLWDAGITLVEAFTGTSKYGNVLRPSSIGLVGSSPRQATIFPLISGQF